MGNILRDSPRAAIDADAAVIIAEERLRRPGRIKVAN